MKQFVKLTILALTIPLQSAWAHHEPGMSHEVTNLPVIFLLILSTLLTFAAAKYLLRRKNEKLLRTSEEHRS